MFRGLLKKSFFKTILGLHHIGITKVMVMSTILKKKNRILSIIIKIHLKCDCIDGSVLNGVRQPIIYVFFSDKPPGYKVFLWPERIHYKKTALNTIYFFKNDINGEVNFNQETLTFISRMIKK